MRDFSFCVVNNNLLEQAQALYTSMFISNADPTWRQGHLSDLITVRYGKDHKKLTDGAYPVYGSGGIMRYAERPLYERESVLIPRKGSVDKLYYVDTPFWNVDTIFYTEIYNLPTRATNRFLRHEYLVQRKIPYVYNMRCRNLLIPDSNKYNIVLCPGSSQVGILKRWPIDSYIELAKKIEASGESVLFVLGNEDADLIQKIKGASFAYEQFDDIKKLFYYTRNAKCVIGNDSAWLHAACVQGTPNVMIVGPSPFIVCHTNDITLHKTVYKKAECAPCKVWQYKCPNKHICMKSIEVEDVFSTVCDIMKNIL